jgi:hypothetical protein
MILLFLPALYAVWFRIKPPKGAHHAQPAQIDEPAPMRAMAAE